MNPNVKIPSRIRILMDFHGSEPFWQAWGAQDLRGTLDYLLPLVISPTIYHPLSRGSINQKVHHGAYKAVLHQSKKSTTDQNPSLASESTLTCLFPGPPLFGIPWHCCFLVGLLKFRGWALCPHGTVLLLLQRTCFSLCVHDLP